jgi:hypothetical protein
MKRREPPEPAGGYLLNGMVYPTEAEYLAAKAKRDERRQRWMEALNDHHSAADSGPRLFQVRAHRDS